MQDTPALCPHCGESLKSVEPLALGALRHNPRGMTTWNGKLIPLTAAEHTIFSAIAEGRGEVTSEGQLIDRLGTDTLANVVQVFMTRVRAKFEEAGAARDIVQTVRGRGYRLNMELLGGSDA